MRTLDRRGTHPPGVCRLDVLVNNAAISNTSKGNLPIQEHAKISRASNASLDEVRAVWKTNVFGVLAVYPARSSAPSILRPRRL
jgi:NAD(P)-dependent dehydrogenase (short-subunit alcohol dehydrogenase family)